MLQQEYQKLVVKWCLILLALVSLRNVLSSFIGFDNKLFALISFGLAFVSVYAYFKLPKINMGIYKYALFAFLICVALNVLRSIPEIRDKYYLLMFTQFAPSLLLFASVAHVSTFLILKRIFVVFFLVLVPCSVLAIPAFLHNLEVVGFYYVLLSIPLLFLDTLKYRRKIFVIFLAIVVCYISYISVARSTVVKFIVAVFVFLCFDYFPRLSTKLSKPVSVVVLILPVFLFIRSIYIEKSFFIEVEEYTSSGSSVNTETMDTRTFVFKEAINSAVNNGYITWGRNFAHGYDSIRRSEVNNLGSNSLNERLSEVGMLNMFTTMGLVGAVFYYVLLCAGTIRSVFFSQNIFTLKIGVYLAFMAFYSWIENALFLNMTTLTMIIILSISLNGDLLKMDNNQAKMFFKNIFN